MDIQAQCLVANVKGRHCGHLDPCFLSGTTVRDRETTGVGVTRDQETTMEEEVPGSRSDQGTADHCLPSTDSRPGLGMEIR